MLLQILRHSVRDRSPDGIGELLIRRKTDQIAVHQLRRLLPVADGPLGDERDGDGDAVIRHVDAGNEDPRIDVHVPFIQLVLPELLDAQLDRGESLCAQQSGYKTKRIRIGVIKSAASFSDRDT